MSEIKTWLGLFNYLKTLSDQQLMQRIQIIPPSTLDHEGVLAHGIAIGTVEQAFGDNKTRSSYDNHHHPEDIVLLTDGNPFGEDGAIAEDLMTGERIFPATR